MKRGGRIARTGRSEDIDSLSCGNDQLARRSSIHVKNAVIDTDDSFFVILPRILGLLIHMHTIR